MTARNVCLGDVADFINGAAFKPGDWGSEGLPIIRIQNLTDPDKPYNRTLRQVDEKYHVHPGDLLVSWSATLDVFQWNLQEVGLLNQHIFRVLPNTSKVCASYLRHILTLALEDMKGHLHGATMQHVNRGAFLGTKIYLPSMDEQRRIAAILDQAEALRTKRRQALAKLHTLTQSLFLEMFGDPDLNVAGWETASLGELIVDGPQNGLYRPSEDYGSGTPILRIDAFYDGRVTSLGSLRRLRLPPEEVARYALTEGDIIINRVNSLEYLGKSAIIPKLAEPTVFESNMMRFRVDTHRIDGFFLMQLLQTPFITKQILGRAKNAVNQSSINQTDVQSFRVIVPPPTLQERFARLAEEVDRHILANERSLKGLESLSASLRDKAFRGEL